jgi:Fic family protein
MDHSEHSKARTQRFWIWKSREWGRWDVSHLQAAKELEMAVRAVAAVNNVWQRLSEKDRLASEALILEQESLETSLIEGKVLDRASVRSSIAQRLGLERGGLTPDTRETAGLVDILLDASRHFDNALDEERLHRWHAALFPTGRSELGYRIPVGKYRTHREPMQVVSGSHGREKVHYEAPPSEQVPAEMARFLSWFNDTADQATYVRAALAKFWFVSIHPYEDGNGRLSRCLSDLAVAQAERNPWRLYSLSNIFHAQGNRYYDVLEMCQKGKAPIDVWVKHFLESLAEAATQAFEISRDVIRKTAFWDSCLRIALNARQRKFLETVLDKGHQFEGVINRKKYLRINKRISTATAQRDIKDLVDKAILTPVATKGRNAGYEINPDLLRDTAKSRG